MDLFGKAARSLGLPRTRGILIAGVATLSVIAMVFVIPKITSGDRIEEKPATDGDDKKDFDEMDSNQSSGGFATPKPRLKVVTRRKHTAEGSHVVSILSPATPRAEAAASQPKEDEVTPKRIKVVTRRKHTAGGSHVVSFISPATPSRGRQPGNGLTAAANAAADAEDDDFHSPEPSPERPAERRATGSGVAGSLALL